jgi:eukaryotic-like serine/threonine-protein kinase
LGQNLVQAAAIGSIIADRYCLLRKLGAGGMGSVWLAHDTSLDSQCAVKLVDPEKAADEEVRIRFEREAKAAAQIRGANVVDIFDHGVWDGTPFIVMEYLEGEDLGARLDRQGALDPEQTYQIVSQVARALVRAHAAGIVHRDLKPENIFLVPGDDQEVAKVLDFGIAKHEQYSLAGKTTKTGSFMGTPYYMSPEQARGRAIDWRSDLWALGVIAFQCLNGRPPFESEALGELMGMIIYDPIPPITMGTPGLPDALELWWQRAVSRDREQRFQSAKELADSFGEAIETSKQMAVPSIAPRTALPSFNDFDGLRALSPRSPVMPSADQSARFSSPALFGDRTPVDEGTEAPVTHTRGSMLPELSSLPRKQRLIVLSVGGALIAVLGFLVIASLQSPPQVSVAAPRPSAAPAIVVTPVPPSKASPPPIIFDPSSLPLEEDQDKKKKTSVGVSAAPGSVPAPAPRPAGVRRDYGI